MSAFPASTSAKARHLDPRQEGTVVLPGDVRFDEARRAWNLAIDQRPAAVVFPESAAGVAAAVVAIDLVTADGRLVRADHEHEPDLFWALRGGGSSFGVVTALEFRLFPLTEAYAGVLWYPTRSTCSTRSA